MFRASQTLEKLVKTDRRVAEYDPDHDNEFHLIKLADGWIYDYDSTIISGATVSAVRDKLSMTKPGKHWDK